MTLKKQLYIAHRKILGWAMNPPCHFEKKGLCTDYLPPARKIFMTRPCRAAVAHNIVSIIPTEISP